jgi:3-deoxy-manno-octulosonate cytidylyltransferase (CMP-KDO synthetase)
LSAVVVIPARYAATRFPGKPLTPIAGVSMLQRVWEGARGARRAGHVVVATDDARIADAAKSFGAEVALTSAEHPTGTDRVAEVARSRDEEIVVNLQGDEPLVEGRIVDAAIEALVEAPAADLATLAHPAPTGSEGDPNRVKVVMDRRGYALYFSRATIPYARDPASPPRYWQHVGIYAYRRAFLLEFVSLPRTAAERSESLEQLRALEHGHRIRVATLEDWESVPVDVPEDVARVEARLRRGA